MERSGLRSRAAPPLYHHTAIPKTKRTAAQNKENSCPKQREQLPKTKRTAAAAAVAAATLGFGLPRSRAAPTLPPLCSVCSGAPRPGNRARGGGDRRASSGRGAAVPGVAIRLPRPMGRMRSPQTRPPGPGGPKRGWTRNAFAGGPGTAHLSRLSLHCNA